MRGNAMPKNEKKVKKRGRQAKQPSKPAKAPANTNGNGSPQSDALVGFEAKLWQMADKLRNNMDAAEYKHVVLGLIFLKYISDAFEEKHAALVADKKSGADPEDADEYRAENIFWVPKEARWTFLQGSATQPKIGKLVDDAMVAIERDNPTLKGVLTQAQLAEFQTSVPNINFHLNAIYDEGKFSTETTIKSHLIVRPDECRQVSRPVLYYNLPAILAVGFRTRSSRGTQFRRWTTKRLESTA